MGAEPTGKYADEKHESDGWVAVDEQGSRDVAVSRLVPSAPRLLCGFGAPITGADHLS